MKLPFSRALRVALTLGAACALLLVSSPGRADSPLPEPATAFDAAHQVTFPSLVSSSDAAGGTTVALQGYLFRPPAKGPAAAVVLLPGCRGLNNALGYRRWVDRLLSWGYVVLAVDSLTPRDARTCFEMDKINPALIGADAYAALKYLRSQPFVSSRRAAVIGYSYGGNGVLQAVQTGVNGRTERLLAARYPAVAPLAFRAAIAFYPVESLASMRFSTPLLILVGERDDARQVQALRDLGERQRLAGDPTTVHVYPNATHAFDMEPGEGVINAPFTYDPSATADAAERVKAFLAAHLR